MALFRILQEVIFTKKKNGCGKEISNINLCTVIENIIKIILIAYLNTDRLIQSWNQDHHSHGCDIIYH